MASYNSRLHSDVERIEGFFKLWFDGKSYTFNSTDSKFINMTLPNDIGFNWNVDTVYLNSLYASLCMENIKTKHIVGDEAFKWCYDNQDEILVVYCGEAFNLEMKYNTEHHEFLFRTYKECHV